MTYDDLTCPTCHQPTKQGGHPKPGHPQPTLIPPTQQELDNAAEQLIATLDALMHQTEPWHTWHHTHPEWNK